MNSFDSTEQPHTAPTYNQLTPSTIESLISPYRSSSNFHKSNRTLIDSLRERDFENEEKMKGDADKRQHLKTNDLRAGDTVRIRQPKKNKLSSPLIPNLSQSKLGKELWYRVAKSLEPSSGQNFQSLQSFLKML